MIIIVRNVGTCVPKIVSWVIEFTHNNQGDSRMLIQPVIPKCKEACAGGERRVDLLNSPTHLVEGDRSDVRRLSDGPSAQFNVLSTPGLLLLFLGHLVYLLRLCPEGIRAFISLLIHTVDSLLER